MMKKNQRLWIILNALIMPIVVTCLTIGFHQEEGKAKPEREETIFDRSTYNPAILRISLTNSKNKEITTLDKILISATGKPIGSRTNVNRSMLTSLIDSLYINTSEKLPLNTSDEKSSSRLLYKLLIQDIEKEIKKRKITTLLISIDPELHKVPFSALHNGDQWLGDMYAYSITPSLSLMPEGRYKYPKNRQYLLAGASIFKGMSPLIFVKQELNEISKISGGEKIIDLEFTELELKKRLDAQSIHRLHVATHAEFIPGKPSESKIHLTNGSISMDSLRNLRLNHKDLPLELLSLSACRTGIGDASNELGLAGLALLAGAQSAIGTLWYIDDIAASIFFVRFYYWLEKGLPKAEAVQKVRREFIMDSYTLHANNLLSPEGQVIIRNVPTDYQIHIREGMSHPYFWSAPVLIGKPW